MDWRVGEGWAETDGWDSIDGENSACCYSRGDGGARDGEGEDRRNVDVAEHGCEDGAVDCVAIKIIFCFNSLLEPIIEIRYFQYFE